MAKRDKGTKEPDFKAVEVRGLIVDFKHKKTGTGVEHTVTMSFHGNIPDADIMQLLHFLEGRNPLVAHIEAQQSEAPLGDEAQPE